MNKPIYGLFFLMISALITTALILHYQPFSYELDPVISSHTAKPIIQESMSGVTAWQYNEQGEKIQSLKMSSWEQFTQDPIVYMTRPALQIKNEDGSTWFLESQSGQGIQTDSGPQSGTKPSVKSGIKPGQFDEVKLLDNVLVSQKQDNTTTLHLSTEALSYIPSKQWVSSEAPVTVTREDMRLQANSMFAELDKKTIQFSGQVDSIYEKPKN